MFLAAFIRGYGGWGQLKEPLRSAWILAFHKPFVSLYPLLYPQLNFASYSKKGILEQLIEPGPHAC